MVLFFYTRARGPHGSSKRSFRVGVIFSFIHKICYWLQRLQSKGWCCCCSAVSKVLRILVKNVNNKIDHFSFLFFSFYIKLVICGSSIQIDTLIDWWKIIKSLPALTNRMLSDFKKKSSNYQALNWCCLQCNDKNKFIRAKMKVNGIFPLALLFT